MKLLIKTAMVFFATLLAAALVALAAPIIADLVTQSGAQPEASASLQVLASTPSRPAQEASISRPDR